MIAMMRTVMACAGLVVLVVALPAQITAAPVTGVAVARPDRAEPAALRELADAAQAHMTAGEYEAAAAAWDRLAGAMPDRPEPLYNRGLAQYHLGRYDEAAASFARARSLADEPDLRARAAYNLGNTLHAKAQAGAASPPASGEDVTDPFMQQLGAAEEALDEALAHYAAALDDQPDDVDARINGELTQRMLQQIRQARQQLQQQQQQQQQQQGQQQQQQGPQQQGESPQPQSGPADQQQEQPRAPEAGARSEQREQPDAPQPQEESAQAQDADAPTAPDEQPQQQQARAQQSQSQPQPDAPQEAQREPQPQPREAPADGSPPADDAAGRGDLQPAQPADEPPDETQPAPADAEADEDTSDRMTREEAQRLLQAVRDRERQRRELLARREAQRQPPVEKDW